MKLKTSALHPRITSVAYVLPNLMTACNLFWGFFSIVKALQGRFDLAAYGIFLAAVFDVLDGKVAKLTKTSSSFGIQFDSLCDLVSFGVAPSLLLFQFSLHNLDRLGWIACFIFLACGAMRLARYNVHNYIGRTSDDFVGLSIPMSALIATSYTVFISEMRNSVSEFAIIDRFAKFITADMVVNYTCLSLTLILSLAMVSTVPYRSHKSLAIRAIKPFNLLVIAVIVIGVVAYRPTVAAFVIGICYGLSGLLEWLFGWKKPVTSDNDLFPADNDGEVDA